MSKKVSKDRECKEKRYLGIAYITVNSFNDENIEQITDAVGKLTMILDKCRIGVYATINNGSPVCGPQGQGCK